MTLVYRVRTCHADCVSEITPVIPPRAYRLFDRGLVAGVAAGLAAHSRLPVWLIRAAFALACGWKLSGAIAYAMLWLVLPRLDPQQPVGLVAAERQGLRTVARRPAWLRMAGWLGALGWGLGVSWLISLYDTTVVGDYAGFVCVMGWGTGLVWLTRETTWPRWGKVVVAVAGVLLAWQALALIQIGLVGWLLRGMSDMDNQYFRVIPVAVGLAVAMCAVMVLPWLVRPARSDAARQAELVEQTRADMAAHLHDSVLQTLTLIQRSAADATQVSRLARRQEKELREWLYGEPDDEESVKAALKDVIAELEATYPVAVELVTVGDHDINVATDALVRAAREAMLNAAKHSGVSQIDTYAEIGADKAEVFVRDRGRGFEMGDIGDDRLGITRSIIGRMARYGGKVDIRSTPGEGTQIHLTMPLGQEES